MTAATVTAATVTAPADRLTRHRRRLRLTATLAATSVRTALVPARARRRRQRAAVCRAARILTALGVRVQVFQPPTPWPRADRFVVTDHVSWLGDLALLTVVRDTPRAATVPGAVPCPVSIRYRTAGGYLGDDAVPRTAAEAVALRDLVVEVHLL